MTHGPAVERHRDGRRPAAAWTSGDAELVVSNRSARPGGRCGLDAESFAGPRDLRVTADGVDVTAGVPAGAARAVAVPIQVGADSAVPVTLSTMAPQPGRPGIAHARGAGERR